MPATTQSPGQQLPLDNTMGVMFLGTLLSAVFFGASVVQSVYYFVHYRGDKWWWLVFGAVAADTLHMACISHTMYHYLITHYYETEVLNLLVWSVVVEAIFNGITGGLVQAFYARRVYLLSGKSKLLTFTILFLVVCEAVSGTAWAVLGLRMKTYQDLLKITPLTITINVLSTVIDVLIAGSLVLNLMKSRTGFKRTNSVVNRLIIFFVNTGLATSLCAIASMVALAVRPDTLVYAFFYFCIGRLYTNSLLASLNSRNAILGSSSGGTGASGPGHNMVSFGQGGHTGSGNALSGVADPGRLDPSRSITLKNINRIPSDSSDMLATPVEQKSPVDLEFRERVAPFDIPAKA